MKNIVLIFVFVFSVLCSNAQEMGKSQALKLNPLSLIVLTGNMSYEKVIGPNQSIQLGFYYSGVHLGDVKYQGFGITPEYRYYFAGRRQAMNGVYFAPFARYQQFNLSDISTNDKATFSSIGGGVTIGWEKAWDGGFVLDIFAGPAYNSGSVKSQNGNSIDITSGINGFGVRSGIALGFSF